MIVLFLYLPAASYLLLRDGDAIQLAFHSLLRVFYDSSLLINFALLSIKYLLLV